METFLKQGAGEPHEKELSPFTSLPLLTRSFSVAIGDKDLISHLLSQKRVMTGSAAESSY